MNVYQKDHTQIPEIFELIQKHDYEGVKKHLKKNPQDIHLKGWMDDTPLHIAVAANNLEIVQYLVQHGADVNVKRAGVYVTPLSWVASKEVAEYLLQKGAAMNHDELFHATRIDIPEIVDLLLSGGATINREEPEYLQCKSIECIKVYLKHHINIEANDRHGRGLPHSLIWLDLPDVLDFVYENTEKWKSHKALRSLYYDALIRKRKSCLDYFLNKFPALGEYTINKGAVGGFSFERIKYFSQSPAEENVFIGLTRDYSLVKYKRSYGEFILTDIAFTDISGITNFAFDRLGRIVLPTADNKLLLVDAHTFSIIETIVLDNDLHIRQITSLSSKNVYLCNADSWKLNLLSEDFREVVTVPTQDGNIFPLVSKEEDFFAFWSYDQEEYYILYHIDSKLNITPLHTFFKDWENSSRAFSFTENGVVVLFPGEIEYYTLDEKTLKMEWSISLPSRIAESDNVSLAFVSNGKVAMAKRNTLNFIDCKKGEISEEQKFEFDSEITGLYVNKDYAELCVITRTGLNLILI